MLGIATFRRWRPGNAPRFVTASLHRALALVAVAFLALHVATAVVDPWAVVGAAAVIVPFAAGRSPFWVGLGALSLDLMAALVVSSLLRAHVGPRTWRAIHLAAYLAWPLALAHSLGMGTDARALWLRAIGGACVAAVLVAGAWRVSHPAGKYLEPRTASA
jgi:predicted ferric reductase